MTAISKDKFKLGKSRGRYVKPNAEQRNRLLSHMRDGQSVSMAARQAGIKYNTARCIIHNWKKHTTISPKMEESRADLAVH